MTAPILVQKLSHCFGSFWALSDIDLDITAG